MLVAKPMNNKATRKEGSREACTVFRGFIRFSGTWKQEPGVVKMLWMVSTTNLSLSTHRQKRGKGENHAFQLKFS